jgi:hypothetical protein
MCWTLPCFADVKLPFPKPFRKVLETQVLNGKTRENQGKPALQSAEEGDPGDVPGGSSQCLMTLVSKSPGVILQVMCLVQPILRNFVIFNLQPKQPLADAWPDAADVSGVRRLVRVFWVLGC